MFCASILRERLPVGDLPLVQQRLAVEGERAQHGPIPARLAPRDVGQQKHARGGGSPVLQHARRPPPPAGPQTPGGDWGEICWPAPEVADNVNSRELGSLGLSPAEEEAIVAFLKTLTDGFLPESSRQTGMRHAVPIGTITLFLRGPGGSASSPPKRLPPAARRVRVQLRAQTDVGWLLQSEGLLPRLECQNATISSCLGSSVTR